MNKDFFTFRTDPDILMNVLEDLIIFVVWEAWVLIFILSKNKGFQSGALLKLPNLVPPMEKFCLDIQNRFQICLKQAKIQLFKNNKKYTKNAGLKGKFKFTGCLLQWMFIINSKVNQQNEPK